MACDPSSGETRWWVQRCSGERRGGEGTSVSSRPVRTLSAAQSGGHNLFPQRRHLCLLRQPNRESPLREPVDQDVRVADESRVGKRTVPREPPCAGCVPPRSCKRTTHWAGSCSAIYGACPGEHSGLSNTLLKRRRHMLSKVGICNNRTTRHAVAYPRSRKSSP